MTDLYLEHGRYTYAATPTWGVAQEGDGSAKGAATPATVSIDLSAATAAAGATISIMGATLTCVASGATTNQFNAGAGATLVSNLVTAINRTTNTSILTAQATGWATPKIQDAVFARIGTPNTTLEIMTRAGSAQYNSSTITTSGFTGGTFGPYTFSGGAGGAWGWLVNDETQGTIWPSAIAAWGYGVHKAAATVRPMAGIAPNYLTDVVHIKSDNQTITFAAAQSRNLLWDAPGIYVLDDGAKWSGVNGTLTLTSPSGSGYSSSWRFNATKTRVSAKTRGALIVRQTGGSGAFTVYAAIAGDVYLSGCKFWDSGSPVKISISNASNTSFAVEDCDYVCDRNTQYAVVVPDFVNYAACELIIKGWTFSWPAFSGSAVPIFGYSGGTSIPNAGRLSVENCIALNGGTPPIFTPVTAMGSNLSASNMIGFSIPNTLLNVVGLLTAPYQDRFFVTQQNIGPNREYRLETNAGVLDWLSSSGYPTLDSVLPNGTYWVWRWYWATTANAIKQFYPIVNLTKTNVLADASRTFKLELLIDTTYASAITSGHLGLEVTYKSAADGTMRVVKSFPGVEAMYSSSALPASSAPWTKNSYTSHTAVKVEVATEAGHNLAQNSEIEATVVMYQLAPTAVQSVFINPEIGIA